MSIFLKRRNALLNKSKNDSYLVVDLARLMPKGIDHTNLFYLTGYSGEGVLIINKNQSVLLADERYFEMAKTEILDDLTVVEAQGNYLNNIKDELKKLSIKNLVFTSNRITYSLFTRIEETADVKMVPVEDPVSLLRMIKDNTEISDIKKAIEISEQCLKILCDEVAVGKTEKDIALKLDILMLEAGADIAFETIVASGPNCFNQHHKPGDKKLLEGEFLLIDFGASYNGYVADITRTFAVKSATSKMYDIYNTVLSANKTGIDNLRSGNSIKDVWNGISGYYETSNFKQEGQISGHSFGIDLHEYPFMNKSDSFVLEPGIVMTMEPGIYLFGYGGVRIEDDVLITVNGPEVLTSFPKEELMILG